MIIGCYVDDLACLHSHDDKHSLYHHFNTSLQKSWEVEDEGDISDLLGVQIDRGKDQATMTQTAYIDRMMTTWCPEARASRRRISPRPPRHHPVRIFPSSLPTPCSRARTDTPRLPTS